ncbi:type II pantothenate kinase, partial [Bacillus cereus]
KKLLTFEKFYSHEQHKIIDWIKNNNGIKQICITGGKSKLLQQLLTGSYKIIELSEFEATLAGVQYILKEEKH